MSRLVSQTTSLAVSSLPGSIYLNMTVLAVADIPGEFFPFIPDLVWDLTFLVLQL